MIDNTFDVVGRQFRARKLSRYTHIALRTGGITFVGVLNNQLARRVPAQ
jgi:hypothetical protein